MSLVVMAAKSMKQSADFFSVFDKEGVTDFGKVKKNTASVFGLGLLQRCHSCGYIPLVRGNKTRRLVLTIAIAPKEFQEVNSN